jgi:hypothetical protein
MVYTPAAGTVLAAGTSNLSVTFTPTDTTNYSTVTKNVPLTVTQSTPVITWASPVSITYGTTLSAVQLNATASVPGTMVYTPAAGAVLTVGTDTLSVTFTPTDTTNYTTATKTVQLTVTQAIPGINWAPPASITYGTALSSLQLSATSPDPGTFVYTPAAGAILPVGTNTLSVTFTPTDTTNHSTVTKTVPLLVTQAAPVITWANPSSITYGTGLSTAQLNATASVPGTMVYAPAAGAVLNAGTDTLSVTFIPTDNTNYTTATQTVQLIVSQSSPTITWAPPAGITYGTALSNAQLNATASVPGSLVYTPAAGSIPAAGTDTLTVTFTPTDTTNYSTATKTVQLSVSPATPVITWGGPASITYGTALSTIQLNATASVAGTFAYTPALGSIPAAGTETLSVTFTPTDTANYTTATKSVQLTVSQATPVITWATPASITYGTALSVVQLNATSSVAGTLTYVPAAGSIPAAGTDTLSVTFTPTDAADYTIASKTVQLAVSQAVPVITWAAPTGITYGTALSAAQLIATASVPGTFTYTPALGSVPTAGTDTLSVTFTPTDTANYTSATKAVPLTVSPETLTIFANSYTRLYGVANPVFQGNITGAQNGDTFSETFSNSASIPSTPGQYPIIPAASGINLPDYVLVVQNGTLTVTQAPVVITTALSTPSIAFGLNVTMTANVASTTSGAPTGTVKFLDNGNPIGTAVLSNGVATFTTAGLQVGTHVIVPVYSGDTDFIASTASASLSGSNTIVITPLDFTLQVMGSPTVEGTYGTTRQYTLHVAPIGGTFPGDVQFTTNDNSPLLSTYTFSPATVSKTGGPTDIILTVATRKLASSESPKDLSSKLSHIALGLFLLPLLGIRYSRRTSKKLIRIITSSVLLLLSLGAIGTMSGCGSGYFDHTYPITITATSNGIQHSVTVDFHIDQSPQ